MIKECVVLNGKVINVGPWDYQKQQVEVSPAEYDEEGNVTKEAVFEEQTMNPLPGGTTTEERDFEYDANRGWHEVGTVVMPTDKDRIAMLEDTINFLLGL